MNTRKTFNLPLWGRFLSHISGPSYSGDFGNRTRVILIPIVAILLFVGFWSLSAKNIQTSLGQLPGPGKVMEQAIGLFQEHKQERLKESEFYERMQIKLDKSIAENKSQEKLDRITNRRYSGPPTFVDQIITSLITVAAGFSLVVLIAIPIGLATGMSPFFYQAMNPLIQLFKPVSPLAWLPLVTLVLSALYNSESPWFEKSFLISAITVALCSLWPTLINTSAGVSSLDGNLVNVCRVLQLSWYTRVLKVNLPSAIPMMFTGLRLSLGIGWMVLIAAEMLAQSPGLGKFVWDEFQNGSSNSLARIMVAIIVIGAIGFLLDRGMLILQRAVSWDKDAVLR